ncbi:MAG: VOC family protein [Polyangiaceae bacterium]
MGNPFVHIDLATSDVAAAKAFYKKVFDWKFNYNKEMDWTGIDVGQGVGGGMGPINTPGQPPAWTAYVDVASVKKTIAKAEKAGAKVVLPYMPIGEMGAIGVFIDPQGATIGVWESTPKPAASAPAADKPAAKKAAAKKPAAKKPAAKQPAAKKPAAKKPAAKKPAAKK